MRLILACLFALLPPAAFADSVRCGDRTARVGDTMAAVRAACGEPRAVYDAGTIERGAAFVRERREPLDPGRETLAIERRRALPVVRWEYDLGPGQFLRILEFEGDRLTAIELGPRR